MGDSKFDAGHHEGITVQVHRFVNEGRQWRLDKEIEVGHDLEQVVLLLPYERLLVVHPGSPSIDGLHDLERRYSNVCQQALDVSRDGISVLRQIVALESEYQLLQIHELRLPIRNVLECDDGVGSVLCQFLYLEDDYGTEKEKDDGTGGLEFQYCDARTCMHKHS